MWGLERNGRQELTDMSSTTAIRDRRILELQRDHSRRLQRSGAAAIALDPSTAAGWWSLARHTSDEFLEQRAARLPPSDPRDPTVGWILRPGLDERVRNLAYVLEGLDPRAPYLTWRTDHAFLEHLCAELFSGADEKRLNDIQLVLGSLTQSQSFHRLRTVLGDKLVEELRGRTTRQAEIGPRQEWLQIAELLSVLESDPLPDPSGNFTPEFLRLWLEELPPARNETSNEALQLLSMAARGLRLETLRLPEHQPVLDAVSERVFDAFMPSDLSERIDAVLSRYSVTGRVYAAVWDSLLEAFRRLRLGLSDLPMSQHEAVFGYWKVNPQSSLGVRDALSERAIASLDAEFLQPMMILNIVRRAAPSAALRDALRTRLEARLGPADLSDEARIDALDTLISGWPALHGSQENKLRVAQHRFADPGLADDRPSNAMSLVRLGKLSTDILKEFLNRQPWGADQQVALNGIGVEQLTELRAIELAEGSERPAQAAIALDLAGLNEPRLLNLVLTSTDGWALITQLLPFLERWSATDDAVRTRIVAAVRAAGRHAPEDVQRAFLVEIRFADQEEAQALIELIVERHLEGRIGFPPQLARLGPFAEGQRRATLLDDVVALLRVRPDIAQTVETLALSPSDLWEMRNIYGPVAT